MAGVYPADSGSIYIIKFMGLDMFLKETIHNEMIEVLMINDLFDPFCEHLIGRYQRGEDVQDTEKFSKSSLCFLSGEPLPNCWTNPHYREHKVHRIAS